MSNLTITYLLSISGSCNLENMNFSLLQSFLSVARHGSFTAAARELFITQPAISQHIQALEEELGVLLFARQGKGVLLTDEGRELQKIAETMMQSMDEAKTGIQERSELKRGQLKIAVTEVMTYLLPPVLIDFKKRYPGVDVHLYSHRAATVMGMVADGRAACGIAHKPSIVPAPLASRFVHEERLILAAPAGHRLGGKKQVSPENLQDETVILRESGTLSRSLAVSWFGAKGVPGHFIEANSMSAMRELVLAGSLAFIPHCVVRHDLETERMVALKASEPYSDMAYKYYLFTRKGDCMGRAANMFMELVAASGLLSSGDNIVDVIC